MTQQLMATCKELIAIPSTTHNLPAVQKAIGVIETMIATRPDITVERFKSNGKTSLLAYYGATRPKKFDVLFNGHVDVVPGTPEQFKPYIKDNRLYGRGAYDMKVACVLMTDVFLQHAGKLPIDIGLQIVPDEEIGGTDGTRVQTEADIKTAFGIIGEMTDLGICNETRGICWAEVTFKGRSAHGGYPWEGHNAVTQASDFAKRILEKFPLPTTRSWTTTANIAAITTDNQTYNRVPDTATVKIDFRFTPEDPHFKTQAAVEAFMRKLDPEIATITLVEYAQAVWVPASTPQLTRFMTAFEQATGKKPQLIKRYASSDTRYFARRGMHCIEFGLGGKNLHADQEYADLATIQPFCDTLSQFLLNTAATKIAKHNVAYKLV